MKKINKILVLSFSFIFALGMTACVDPSNSDSNSNSVEEPSSTPNQNTPSDSSTPSVEDSSSDTSSTPSVEDSSSPSSEESSSSSVDSTTPEDSSTPAHTHNLTKVDAVSATCTTDGNVEYYTCDGCEELFSDAEGTTTILASAIVVAKTGHNLTAVPEVPATCTEDGVKAYWTCSGCDVLFADPMGMTTTKLEQLVIPASHNIEHHDAVAATCTTAGNIEYWHCSGCETYYSDEQGSTTITAQETIIAALGHNMTHHEATNATCTEDGNKEYWTCGTCEKYFADEEGNTETSATEVVLNKTGHTLQHVTYVPATCTENGIKEHWFCDVCDKYFRDENAQNETSAESTIIVASGHNMTYHAGKEATCTEDGSKEYWTCDKCNKMYLDEAGTTVTTLTGIYVAPKGHSLTHVEASTPTCQEYGYIEHYDCANCDAYFKDEQGKIPTTLEEVRINKAHNMTHHDAVAKTCTTAGSKEYWQCGTCKAIFLEASGDNAVTEQDLVVPASHNLKAIQANPATCTVNGNIAYYHCEDCNKYYSDEKAENEISQEETVIIASHNMDHHDAAEATCTETGNVEYWYCEKCDGYYLDEKGQTASSLVEVTIPATGHSTDTKLEITQVVDGVATVVRSCTNGCNASNITYEVAAPTVYSNKITNDEELAAMFTVDKDYDYTFNFVDGVLENSNSKISSSNAYLELTALTAGTFTFDLAIWSEAGWDHLTIYKNGSSVFSSKTDIPGISNNVEGKATLSYELAAGDKIKFDKKADSGMFYGPAGDKDYAKISNMSFVSASVPEDATYSIVDFDANGGNEVAPMVAYTNNTLESLPEATRTGYIFLGWYTDTTYETEFTTSTIISANTKAYAKWFDASLSIPCSGEYVGYNVYGAGYVSGTKYSLSIDVLGNASGYINGVIAHDSETNTYSIVDSDKVIAYDPNGILVIGADNSDMYVFIRNASEATVKAESFKDEETNYTIKLIEYTINEETTAIMVKGGKIYKDVTYTSIFTPVNSVAEINNISDIVVKDVDGNVLVSVGYNGTDYAALDAVYGVYTNATETLKVGGLGTLSYNDVEGTYTFEENTIFAYVGDYYYEFTLEGESFAVVKPMVKVTYVTGEGHNPIPSNDFNKNIVAELPVLEEANYVFNGWYFDAEFTSKVPAEFAPTENVSLYAKWSAPAIVTVNANNGEEANEVIYSVGDTTDIDNPVWTGHIFVGWYTTATFEEGSEWANGEILEDVAIYAKWEDAPIYSQTYGNMQLNGETQTGGKSSLYSFSSAYITVDELGKATGTAYPFKGSVSFDNYNKATGYVEISVDTSVYVAYVDSVTGIAIMNQSKGLTEPMSKVFVLSPFEQSPKQANFASSYWNGGMSRVCAYTYNEVTYYIFINNNVAYFNVNITDLAGNAIVDFNNAYSNASGVKVTNANGELIAEFGYDGTQLVELDGLQGTYTNGEDTIVLDGVATVTLNGVSGTYSIAQDASYSLNVYVDNTYYEVTLDGESYTVNKPMVNITYNYNYEGSTSSTVSVNKNIGMTLEVPSREGYVFMGWMSTADGTASDIDAEITPEADVTYYALWAKELTVTIYYGNGLGVGSESVGAGEVPALTMETTFKDGYVFAGWYTSSTFAEGTEYKFTAIEESMNVYAKWNAAVAQYGSYKGFEVWGSSANGGTTSGGSSSMSIEVDAEGNITGKHSGTITEYNPETKTFKLVSGTSYRWGYFDAENGILAYAYSSDKETLGNDVYLYIRGVESALTGSSLASYWNSGLSRLMTVNLVGHEKSSVNLFIHEDIIHYDVTFEATGVENLQAKDAYSQNDLRVYDSNGDLIAEFMKKDGKLVVKALDGYQGSYTIGSDTLVLDGYGVATLNGASGTYSVNGNKFTVTVGTEKNVYEYDSESKSFSVVAIDALEGKTFSYTFSCSGSWYDEHTTKFVFDGMGGVKVTFTCTDNYSYCSATYTSNSATYTFVDGVVTIVSNSKTMVFSVNDAANPTSLTCTSTSVSSSDDGYFATGSTFEC